MKSEIVEIFQGKIFQQKWLNYYWQHIDQSTSRDLNVLQCYNIKWIIIHMLHTSTSICRGWVPWVWGSRYVGLFLKAIIAFRRKITKWLPEVYHDRKEVSLPLRSRSLNTIHAKIMGTFNKCRTLRSQHLTRSLRHHSVYRTRHF